MTYRWVAGGRGKPYPGDPHYSLQSISLALAVVNSDRIDHLLDSIFVSAEDFVTLSADLGVERMMEMPVAER